MTEDDDFDRDTQTYDRWQQYQNRRNVITAAVLGFIVGLMVAHIAIALNGG